MDKKRFLDDIGERLINRRKSLGLTQAEASELADVLQQTISDAENGKIILQTDTLYKICQAYKVSSDYLITGEIADADMALLDNRVRRLPPEQFRHLEVIIDHYISAVMPE